MDINRLINGFLGSAAGGAVAQTASQVAGGARQVATGSMGSGMGGGLAGGALAGGAVALLLGSKKARKMGGKALTYGGVAALGGLAYMAYRNYKTGQASPGGAQAAPSTPGRSAPPPSLTALPQPPADSGFDTSAPDAQGHDLRLALIQAMISAAKADGHIDAAEHALIGDQINAMDLAGDEKAFLFDAMQAPSDPLTIAALARGEAQAAELYLASLLAVDPDTPEEQRYLERLGDALRLPEALRAELAQHAAAAKAEAQGL